MVDVVAIAIPLAIVWIPIIAAVVAVVVLAGTAAFVYVNWIAPDHPDCWQEAADLREEALEDGTASCPSELKVRLCKFPEGRVVVRDFEI